MFVCLHLSVSIAVIRTVCVLVIKDGQEKQLMKWSEVLKIMVLGRNRNNRHVYRQGGGGGRQQNAVRGNFFAHSPQKRLENMCITQVFTN